MAGFFLLHRDNHLHQKGALLLAELRRLQTIDTKDLFSSLNGDNHRQFEIGLLLLAVQTQ
eukprot:11539273-Ditylum_brightwellii.AAC.1